MSFFTASLNDQDFSFLPEVDGPDFSFTATVTADAPLTLTVFGTVLDSDGNPNGAGSYHGTINASSVAAVPEPETDASMLPASPPSAGEHAADASPPDGAAGGGPQPAATLRATSNAWRAT